ncbi:MAG: S-layer homology domain-containing protein [Solibacillus sp.]
MKKQTYKKLFTVATASAMAAGAVVAVAPTQADAASPFKDLKETNTHYSNIVELTQRGVITGYEDGTYRAGNSINRAQAAKIIAGVLGLDTTNVKNPGFSDVSEKNANYGPIAALANAGIINGFEGKFNPGGTLTRGQMAKIIDNAFNLSGGEEITFPFTDVAKSQYKVHIANLFANEVTTGVTATKFDEKSPVTRGQLASFVARAEKVAGSEKPGTETPGATTSTVEKAVTVLNVTNNLVTINGEQFEVAPEVASVFNTANAEALKDAETTLVIEYKVEPTASLANVAKKGKIVGVKTLKITKSGVTFNAKGYTIPSLSVTGNNVTLANVVTPALEVAAGNTVTLNGVTATTITVGKGAKITIDANTKLTTIKLAPGEKIENVIANYAAVKDQLKDVKVEGSTSGGGGGGSSSGGNRPVTKAELDKALDQATDTINNQLADSQLTIGSVNFANNKLTIDLTTLDTAYTVAEARTDLAKLKAIITNSDIYKLAEKVTFENGSKEGYTKSQLTGSGELVAGGIIATGLFGEKKSEELMGAVANKQNLLKVIDKETYTVTLTFVTSDKKVHTKEYSLVIK